MFKGKAYPIELVASRNPKRETTIGLVVLRQISPDAELGQTLLQMWTWDDLERHRLPLPLFEGALDRGALIILKKAIEAMLERYNDGEKETQEEGKD
jgi:hypothetical protein